MSDSKTAAMMRDVTPTPCGVWVRIEEFRGNPEGDPLVWWWNERGTEKMATDEALLDGDGLICGKGMCGLGYYTHVMLAEFPEPPPSLNEEAGLPLLDDVRDILAINRPKSAAAAAAADMPRKIAASYCDDEYAEEAERQIRALVKWHVARALEEAAALCEARADAGMASGSWDGGISAWDAAQILAAAIREMVPE